MPWWAHMMAVEGLAEERPWLPGQVEMVEGVDRSDPLEVYDADPVSDAGVFVGVRPEEVRS